MRKDYFTIEDDKELNSIQNVYLTHTTIMEHLIDTNTYERMMVEVCNDIYYKDDIVEDIKKLKRKQRIFLCRIIYNWTRREWNSNPSLPKNAYAPSKFTWSNGVLVTNSWRVFHDRLEEAFSEEVMDICRYEEKAKQLDFKIEQKGKKFNIVIRESPSNHHYYDVFGRMVVKYDEEKRKLCIGYIENIVWNHSYRDKLSLPQTYRVELFRGVKKILKNIYETTGVKLEVTCHKKYKDLFEDAIKRGYLEYLEENENG